MATARANEVTRLLQECSDGSDGAVENLVPLVYDELRVLAKHHLKGERLNHTLQPTALVHEAYFKLVNQKERQWKNSGHFFCAAATAMRRILINHAARHTAKKRGGQRRRVPLDDTVVAFQERAGDLTALDEALSRLERMDPSKSRVVELRFFAGMTIEQTAQVLEISTRTVERHWRVARAWLRKETDLRE